MHKKLHPGSQTWHKDSYMLLLLGIPPKLIEVILTRLPPPHLSKPRLTVPWCGWANRCHPNLHCFVDFQLASGSLDPPLIAEYFAMR